MQKHLVKAVQYCITIACIISLWACKVPVAEVGPDTNPSANTDITATITLNKTSLELVYGESFTVTAKVLPENFPQEITWSVDNPAIVTCTDQGVITAQHTAGTAVVKAVLKNNSSICAECTVRVSPVTVKPAGERQYTVTLSSPFVSFGQPAVLTVTPAPAYSNAAFAVTSDSTDIRISKDKNNPYRFVIEAADKNIAAGEALIRITPSGTEAGYEQTVKITLKPFVENVPALTGPDCMYKDETINFSLQHPHAENETEHPAVWSIECNNPHFEAGKWIALSNGQVTINEEYKTVIPHGEKFKIRAVFQGYTVEKLFTVYNNIARVDTVDCDMTEYTLGDAQKPSISITFENDSTAYKHFWITEYGDGFKSSCFTQTVYELSDSHTPIVLPCRFATSAKPRTFYILPIDPKTNEPVTNAVKKSFSLTIWKKFQGIVLEKGNFAIKQDSHDTTKYTLNETHVKHNQPSNSFHFFIKQEPLHSKPVEITVKASHGTDIVHSLISEKQPDGRLKVSFGTQRSKIGVSEQETIVCSGGGSTAVLHIAIN